MSVLWNDYEKRNQVFMIKPWFVLSFLTTVTGGEMSVSVFSSDDQVDGMIDDEIV